MAEITCKQCGHVNEGERVYCHSCGAKLERSLLPEDPKPETTREKERDRIKKLTNPPRDLIARELSTICLVVLWGAVAAALIQIARPPDGVPTMSKEHALEAPQIDMDLEGALQSPQKIALTEDGINAFLRNKIKAGEPGLAGTVKFERVFVKLDDGVCGVVSQRAFLGYPLYGTILYRLAIADNKLQATCVGGYFGRLPVNPKLMASLTVIYQDLWDKLKPEHKVLDQMASIEVTKKDGVIVSTGPAPK